MSLRALAFAFLVLLACGGETSAVDAGSEAPPLVCWADARTDTSRACTSNADCAVVDHVADCCGSLVENGVRVDQVNAVHEAELAANAGCTICKCMPNATVDESGASGGAYIASCDNGLCTAHAQN
jgi:hypothetical protein